MNIFKEYATDESLEKDGVWYDIRDKKIVPEDEVDSWRQIGSAGFKLARAGGANDKFQKLLDAKLKPHRRRLKDVPASTLSKVLAEAFADTVVVDWQGIADDSGPIAFSREQCRLVLSKLPDLCKELQEIAEESANYRREQLEEESKN